MKNINLNSLSGSSITTKLIIKLQKWLANLWIKALNNQFLDYSSNFTLFRTHNLTVFPVTSFLTVADSTCTKMNVDKIKVRNCNHLNKDLFVVFAINFKSSLTHRQCSWQGNLPLLTTFYNPSGSEKPVAVVGFEPTPHWDWCLKPAP